MLTFGLICALVATASAGYASSSSGGAGLYNSNNYDGGDQYSAKYPYSNQYSGYASAGGVGGAGAGAFPFVPFPAIPSPFQFNNAFQQYYNSLNAFNAKQATMTLATEGAAVSAMASLGPTKYRSKKISNLYNQQLAHQANVFSQIQSQALGGGGGYAGAGGFGGGAAFGGAGAGGYGGSVGSFGSTGGNGGQAYGGTYGGGYPSYNQGGGGGGGGGANYASSGGSVGYGGQQLQASIYPANQYTPNLDSRFGDDAGRPGVTHSQGAPGFSGVSSFSSSSDINGVKNRESATSVNNNGKVTTYHVRS